MKLSKIGAIAILAIAGQALAQSSKMTYTVELGGNNNRTDWKTNCATPRAVFSGGSSANGQDFTAVTSITWDAKVSVTGVHATKGTPLGAANIVFSLELRGPAPSTALVASFGKGSASTGGFYSSINDGTAGCGGTDPDEAAAFPVAFTFNAASHGRLIDLVSNGGPGFDYYQYGSTMGFPAASTALGGQLLGVGAGYSKFVNSQCPGAFCGFFTPPGEQAVGVGSADGTCGLGSPAIAEGQLNTTGLANGTYTLTLIPGSGNNILDGDISCNANGGVDEGDFAVAPDDATAPLVGASISFLAGSGGTCHRTIAARKVFYDNSFYSTDSATCHTVTGQALCSADTAIDPNKTAQLPGSGAATYANYINYSNGLNGLVIDITHDANCSALAPTAAMFTFTTGNVANPATAAPAPSSVTSVALNATTDRVYIRWPNLGQAGSLPNRSWLKVVVKSEVNGGIPGLGADDTFYWGLIVAEDGGTVGSAFTTAQDEIDARNNTNALVRFNLTDARSKFDYNKDSQVTASDQVIARNNTNALLGLTLFAR